jgi:hypothetical protein
MFTWRLRIRAIPIAYEGTYRCYVQVQLQIKAFEERVIIVYGMFYIFIYGKSYIYAYIYVCGFNFSLKIFSETIIPRKLISCRIIPCSDLFRICMQDSWIPNLFQTGSEKLHEKGSFIILNFLWPIHFWFWFQDSKGMKNTNFNAQ